VKAFDSGGGGATVNGVVFAAGDGELTLQLSVADADAGADLGDPGLDLLLRTAGWSLSSSAPFTLSGLTLGNTYEPQFFSMDQRDGAFLVQCGRQHRATIDRALSSRG
jgi:hypothetical protein